MEGNTQLYIKKKARLLVVVVWQFCDHEAAQLMLLAHVPRRAPLALMEQQETPFPV